jgi:predicted DNA-binding transcriptional regulator YafY
MTVLASTIDFNEAILRLAVIHGKKVEFHYEKSAGEPIEHRQLEPKSIHQTAKGEMTFIGHDPLREATRSFRIDRIKGEVEFA